MAVFLHPDSRPHRLLTEFARFFVPQPVVEALARLPDCRTRRDRQRYAEALDDLERRQLVLLSPALQGGIAAFPTPRGRKLLVLSRLPRSAEAAPARRRDLMVTYDVPRVRNADRDLLRNFLRRIGFVGLQYSTWVGPSSRLPVLVAYLQDRKLTPLVHWSPWRRTRPRRR